jgi:nucleoside 2-deoxyribosyltransferase
MVHFSKLRKIKRELLKLGHQVFMPTDFGIDYITISNKKYGQVKKEKKAIKKHFEKIKKSEAILVCNFDKKGIKNYIGGNTFLEIGYAYILGKKIFLLNPIPKMLYEAEIIGMEPIILKGDLRKIK